MRVIGLAMMRNEEDVADHVVRHMLNQDLDIVVVMDNLSTDLTREILDDIDDDRLFVGTDYEPAYYQSQKMTALAQAWADPGDWIVPFDADEVWGTRGGMPLADRLRVEEDDVVVGYPYVHVPQWDDPVLPCPFRSTPKRVLTPEVWPKAALRWADGVVIEQGNHWTKSRLPDTLDIRHFQYRSYEHYARKVKAGKVAMELTDLPYNSSEHWRRAAEMEEAERRDWWDAYMKQDLVFDPPECRA